MWSAVVNPPPTKDQLLDLVRAKREAFEASLAGLTDDECLVSGVAGYMSVKDILAHITWWELLTLQKLNGDTTSETPEESDSSAAMDSVNSAVYAKHRDQSLAEIRAASRASYQLVMESLAGFTEKHLRDNLEAIAGDTYAHYDAHAADVLAWRATYKPQEAR
jgi:hypothetical protein